MATKTSKAELPDQDYDEIQAGLLLIQGSRDELAESNLFTDPTFPPDSTSLTYVYSGDDTYEKVVFLRPKDQCVGPSFCGVGGVCDIAVYWKPHVDKLWIQMALGVVSVNSLFLDRLLPGYRTHEQNFGNNYTGAFQIHLWRFGQWNEAVVDDWLPVLDGFPAFCPSLGSPPEYWGPLVEKAYAKCHKAYEAIETGQALNALTDFTGNICEYFAVSPVPDSKLYHILLKSSLNRSHMVCWPRHGTDIHTNSRHRLRRKGQEAMNGGKSINSDAVGLHIITAVTKFPLKDGSAVGMMRLKDPYCKGRPCWSGDFSRRSQNWSAVHEHFMASYKPLHCLDAFEYWISFSHFSSFFSHVVICSSSEGSVYEDFDTERKYKPQSRDDFTNLSQVCNGDPGVLMSFQNLPDISPSSFKENRSEILYKDIFKLPSREITVCESPLTVKMDTVARGLRCGQTNTKKSSTDYDMADSYGDLAQSSPSLRMHAAESDQSNQLNGVQRRTRTSQTRHGSDSLSSPVLSCQALDRSRPSAGRQRIPSDFMADEPYIRTSLGALSASHGSDDAWEGDVNLSIASSVQSNLSEVSHSSSQSHSLRESKGSKSRAATNSKATTWTKRHGQYLERGNQSGRVSPEETSNASTLIFESRMDYFRSHGGWQELLVTYGRWKKSTSGGPHKDLDKHSKNARLAFTINKADQLTELCTAPYHGKAHVLVSLVQDYRLNSIYGTSLIMAIGFTIYKIKNIDKDRKRHLSKLCRIVDVTSESECREVTARIDLSPGTYILVPYTLETEKEGDYLVRMLCQRDEIGSKQTCVLS